MNKLEELVLEKIDMSKIYGGAIYMDYESVKGNDTGN